MKTATRELPDIANCGYCDARLTAADLQALCSGTVDDHWPCGLPMHVPDGGEFPADLEIAPPGAPLSLPGGHLQQNFDGAFLCDGMGV